MSGLDVLPSDSPSIGRMSILERIEAPSQKAYIKAGHSRVFGDGERIVGVGDRSLLMTILSGTVSLDSLDAAGRRCSLPLLGQGQLFGEACALTGRRHNSNATAVGVCEIHFLSLAAFEDLCVDHPDIAIAVIGLLAERLHIMNLALDELRRGPVVETIAWFLEQLGRPTSENGGKGLLVDITQACLVDLIGSSRPTVARALAELREHRLIETSYRRITVPDKAALANWVSCRRS